MSPSIMYYVVTLGVSIKGSKFYHQFLQEPLNILQSKDSFKGNLRSYKIARY